jgi:hypothetical protein
MCPGRSVPTEAHALIFRVTPAKPGVNHFCILFYRKVSLRAVLKVEGNISIDPTSQTLNHTKDKTGFLASYH